MFALLLVPVLHHLTQRSLPDSILIPDIPGERHLRNVRQLTFGGQNAEAYWSADGKQLCWQSLRPEYPDEQIFAMNADGSNKRLISTSKGRCTCSYFSPDGRWIYFSSTHATAPGRQPPVDKSKGYVWMVNPNFAMYKTPAKPMKKRTWIPVLNKNSYVAETTIAPNGKYMVFTSDFQGDLDIYRSRLDGSQLKRLTNRIGYDGGPFVSWDSKKVVYRRQAVESEAQRVDYLGLLAKHLVRPTKLEIWIMDADGSHKRQVTHMGVASFAPFLMPDGKRILFSSNYGDPKGREFDVYMINVDGSGLERITTSPDFDGFPMITRDGKKLAWASNRHGSVKGETNVFVADWVD